MRSANLPQLSPLVRRLTRDNGLDPGAITGTGAQGRVTGRDVQAHLRSASADLPASRIGRITADHPIESPRPSVHVLSVVEVDFHNIDRARRAEQQRWSAREGFPLSRLPFICRAALDALREFPRLNAAVTAAGTVEEQRRVNLGIALDLDDPGHLVPVIDTPISEQAILGAAMGAAMTGLRPIAEIMFSDFFAVCWDLVVNEIAKMRYMSNGQVTLPLVIKSGNGGGLRFGAQHSQSVENWAMAVPGLKVVTPSTPHDVVGLMAAAVRSDDPVLFFEHKGLYASKGEVPDGEITDTLGSAAVRRAGTDATVLALGLMVGRAVPAAEELAAEGIDVEVIDVRSLVPLDTRTILGSVSRTGRLFTVEENPRLLGWGAEIASIAADECFWDLDMPIRRITTPQIPLPSADSLEDAMLPSVPRIVQEIRKGVQL